MESVHSELQTAHWAVRTFREADLVMRSEAMRYLLEDCCRNGTALEFHGGCTGEMCRAFIVGIGEKTLVLDLEPESRNIAGNSLSTLTFVHEERLYSFTGIALRIVEASRPEHRGLEMELPTEIHSSQVRRSFRIPAKACAGLAAEIEFAGASLACAVADVSLGGVKIALMTGDQGRIQATDQGRVSLVFRELRASREVIVRRRSGDNLNLQFIPDEAGTDGSHLDTMRLLIALGDAWQEGY